MWRAHRSWTPRQEHRRMWIMSGGLHRQAQPANKGAGRGPHGRDTEAPSWDSWNSWRSWNSWAPMGGTQKHRGEGRPGDRAYQPFDQPTGTSRGPWAEHRGSEGKEIKVTVRSPHQKPAQICVQNSQGIQDQVAPGGQDAGKEVALRAAGVRQGCSRGAAGVQQG